MQLTTHKQVVHQIGTTPYDATEEPSRASAVPRRLHVRVQSGYSSAAWSFRELQQVRPDRAESIVDGTQTRLPAYRNNTNALDIVVPRS